MTFGDILHRSAIAHPDNLAVVSERRSIRYQALDESSDRLAGWLLDQGLRAGDRAAIHWPNSVEVVQLFCAMLKAGAVPSPGSRGSRRGRTS